MLKLVNVVEYLMLLILMFIFSFKYKKKKLLLLFAVLFLISFGVRDLGVDNDNYMKIFYDTDITEVKLLGKLELLIFLIIKLIRGMGLGFNTFFIIMFLIPLSINYWIIIKHSEYKIFSMFLMFLLLFFSGYINGVRQCIAASLILLSYYFSSEKKKIKEGIIILLAFMSHYSSIIIIFLKPFYFIKWSTKKILYTTINIILITSVLKFFLIDTLEQIDLNNIIYKKFKYYVLYYNSIRYVYENWLHKLLLWYLIIIPQIGILGIVMMISRKKDELKLNNFEEKILKSSIIGTLIALFFIVLGASTIGTRINLSLSFGIYLLIEKYYRYFLKKAIYEISIIIIYFSFFTIINIAYNAGIFNHGSPFYIL